MLSSTGGAAGRFTRQLASRCQPATAAVLAGCSEGSATCSGRPCSSEAAAQADPGPDLAQVKGMMYRAKQRGFLELDLIVGLWAEEHLPHLQRPQLAQLQTLLECENPDLFKWLTGQANAPAELEQNGVFQSMQRSVRSKLKAKMPHKAASVEGKEWVRGWDDTWRENASESTTVPATGDHIPK